MEFRYISIKHTIYFLTGWVHRPEIFVGLCTAPKQLWRVGRFKTRFCPHCREAENRQVDARCGRAIWRAVLTTHPILLVGNMHHTSLPNSGLWDVQNSVSTHFRETGCRVHCRVWKQVKVDLGADIYHRSTTSRGELYDGLR
jgi:hypothetical protein